MTNILIAIDGSDAALQACRLIASYVGDRSALHVTLLNVQRPPVHFFPTSGVQQPLLETALAESGARALDAARAVLASSGLVTDSIVRIGSPAEVILEVASTRNADALVMGSGRHGLIGGPVIGSVAMRVSPAAPCPVVLVQHGARLPSELGKRLRVTAPVDGSSDSARAVKRLAACAGMLGLQHVDLVHFQPGLSLAAAVLPPHDDVLKEWGSLESDAALRGPTEALSEAGIPYELHRISGAPDVGIASFAKQHDADLIAMATRGRGAIHHYFLGSVALRTAHASDVPVALMR
jgi:nucleotide-binding universal stress UspA family protein